MIRDSRLIYYLIREIDTWLNINHITVHNNTYCIFEKSKETIIKNTGNINILNKLVIYVIFAVL